MSWRMPAEWAAHDRTLMAWPAREDMWGDHWEAAQETHAAVAHSGYRITLRSFDTPCDPFYVTPL